MVVTLSARAPTALADTFEGDITRFSPDVGQPLFPAGNINIFKQYVLGFDVSERVGGTVNIDLLFTTLRFGGELAGGVNAAVGLEVGLCFGGNADFDLGFKPTVTVPERYPTEFPIRLTVAEGLLPDSHFTTTFPPLGQAYADLIFELGAHLKATACVFGCFTAIDFNFSTCDLPPIGGYKMFKHSVRCDPTVQERAYCAVELASFNRLGDSTFRMLNVTAGNRFEFIAQPYKEFTLAVGAGGKKTFTVNPDTDTLQISGVHRFSDGAQVRLSTTGTLPGGLNGTQTYFVNRLSASGAAGIEFQLATRAGGAGIDITNPGSGQHEVTLSESSKPAAPSIGKYGTISISAPTVGTDSRTSPVDNTIKPFSVDPVDDRLFISTLPGYQNGNRVKVTSIGKLPGGLSRSGVYYVTNATTGGLSIQLAAKLGGPVVDIRDSGTGTHRISRAADFNSTQGLKSSGAEDIMAIGVDVAKLVSDLVFPPSFPSLSDSGSVGPIGWHYTLASLNLGPAVQLQTDFELTWNLRVTNIIFRQPGTFVARSVMIDNQTVTALSQVTPARTVYYTNTGPHALPSIVLPNTDPVQVTITYVLEPKLKTVVSTPFLGRVKYAALGAGASIKKVGEFNLGPLIKGEHVFKVGEFDVYKGDPSSIDSAGPRSEFAQSQDLGRYDLRLVDTAKETVPATGLAEVIIYKTGSTLWIRIFDVTGERITDRPAAELLTPAMLAELEDQLDPWPISSLTNSETEKILQRATAIAGQAPGTITFALQAAGPPSYFWRPGQLGNAFPYWTYKANGPITNWLEIISIPPSTASYPGEFGSGSDATIDQSPFPTLYALLEIASLRVAANRRLDIVQPGDSTTGLTVWGGVVDNNGTINITGNTFADVHSFVRLNKTEVMLTGTGTLHLEQGAQLKGPADGGAVTFTNYNSITGNGLAMDLYLTHTDSTIKNMGSIIGAGTGGQYLITSAHHYVNHGGIYASPNGGISLKGDLLENRAGSHLSSLGAGANAYFTFREVELAGRAIAGSGGYFSIAPRNTPRTAWNAGLSFNDEVGEIIATDANAIVALTNADVTGGRIRADRTGSMQAYNSTFSGSRISVGKFAATGIDAASGHLIINGAENVFTKVSLNNYGTVRVNGTAEFIDTDVFANNGTVMVPAGGTLIIHEVTPQVADPNVSEVARSFPGTANATGETLVGGTWDISGTLVIHGATFTGTGANAARSDTSYGSIDENTPGAQTALAIEDDLSRVLSLGSPANVILRGVGWSFPAFATLRENAGLLHLTEGADFPSGGSTQRTAGDFTNYGEVRVDAASALKVGGSYIQTGVHAHTEILAQGEISSTTQHFQITGGSVNVASGGYFMNRNGNSFYAGTTILVASPLIDTNEVDFLGRPVLEQERVSVHLGTGVTVTTIAQGVDITLHGAAVVFPALTAHLTSNAGRFTISGDGIDNAGVYALAKFTGQTFTNTGEFTMLGWLTKLSTGNYVQSGAGASTRIGAGTTLTSFGRVEITGGEIILEIASRPREDDYGQLTASQMLFNDRLVIDFTDKIADTIPDIGDTWEIVSRKTSAAISGVTSATVTYRHNGEPMPAGWLPAGSHLEVVRFDTDFGQRGLGIRVVPDAGFIAYDDWVAANGLDRASFLSDPLRDANSDGIINALEYLFGANDGDGTFPGQQQQGLINVDGQVFYELSYVRPSGVDAVYMPYYSRDLVHWYVSSMNIMAITDAGSGLEWVTLRSTFPIPDGAMYFRVRGFLNVDSFDIGLLPDNPINHGSGLNNFDQTLRNSLGRIVSYVIEPGKVLYFNVNASAGSSSIYGGTAPNGIDRNFIYQDRSALQSAVVHAGLLNHGQRGIIKVTFIAPQQTTFIGSTQNQNSPNQVTSSTAAPNAAPYSYMVELEEAF
jgi:hypothetical protein